MEMKEKKDFIALALDNISTIEEIEILVQNTYNYIGVYKIGLEQFTRSGPDIVRKVQNHGCKIFLDLKFHDIPNTVAKAVTAACTLGIDYLTLHCQGGIEMLQAAVKAADDFAGTGKKRPCLLGVTLLTSIDETILRDELQVSLAPDEYVASLASLAVKGGLDGLVCSASDISSFKNRVPAHFEIVTPGIRPAGGSSNDQKRIVTPKNALTLGATLLVIGRPITAAANPAEAAADILKEISI
jgi:orotidine-5'-phosphate decarboxylase